jgi:ATP-dependent DNA helicase RecQ
MTGPFSIDQNVHQILKDRFGYASFRMDQLSIIRAVLEGKDTLAIMPTGGGKSICYQVPALYLDGITLVISPLISLMQDQVMNLKELGIEACFLNSSLSPAERYEAQKQITSGRTKIVYVSPEGILSIGLSSFFSKLKISLIAIDEAHCVSQWGHEFRKDYTRLSELRMSFPGVPVLALTATADAKTRIDIAEQLRMLNPEVFIASFDRPNIKYSILDREDEIKQLTRFIETQHPQDTGIIYCLSRSKVERIAETLAKKGYPALPYHAGLSQEERASNQAKFSSDERVIVVATIAFGMGIDRPDVRFVAHLDLPKSIESYYQETGRAGRDGKPSSAWMIYGLQDVVKLSQMLETTEADEKYKKVARHKLDAMLGLGEVGGCRRKYLLSYFGQELAENCDYCDTCQDPPVLWDATIDSQKILSTIYRTQQIYGAGHIIDVLRGANSAKVIERKHDALSVFGIGKDKSKDHWNNVLRQLLHSGFVMIKDWEYRSLGLTEKALPLLKGQQSIHFRKQEISENKSSKKLNRNAKSTENNHGRDELFSALKELRTQIARENKVPPYIIFSDKTLNEMCHFLPQNSSDLLMVSGVGQTKQEKYGNQFLSIIKKWHLETK